MWQPRSPSWLVLISINETFLSTEKTTITDTNEPTNHIQSFWSWPIKLVNFFGTLKRQPKIEQNFGRKMDTQNNSWVWLVKIKMIECDWLVHLYRVWSFFQSIKNASAICHVWFSLIRHLDKNGFYECQKPLSYYWSLKKRFSPLWNRHHLIGPHTPLHRPCWRCYLHRMMTSIYACRKLWWYNIINVIRNQTQ